MLDFLKRFGLGIVYLLMSPFILLFLFIWTLYGIGIFFVEIFKGFKSFFKGKKFFEEFPEDVEAKRILNLDQAGNNQNSDNISINIPVEENKNEDKTL